MRLRTAGFHLGGPGYPNAARTLRLLEQNLGVEIDQFGTWLPDDFHLWRLARGPRWRAAVQLSRLLLGNLASLIRVMHAQRRVVAPVYIPYPSLFLLWLVSCLPVRWRPLCIADAYISVWDALYRDRAGDRRNGLGSRLLKSMEGRALRAAAQVLVDTRANRDCLIEDFGLDPARVHSFPLAIEEAHFSQQPLAAPANMRQAVRILFVGTLIPLHGVPVLLDAMRLLRHDTRLQFRIIGDGQLGHLVEQFAAECTPGTFTWVREWYPMHRIAAEISMADICLGVFGGEAKAARVLPFKLYMYLAAGKAIVTQAALSTPYGVSYPPIRAVQSADADELADAISCLADDPVGRAQLGAEAVHYYHQQLSNACVVECWRTLLAGLEIPR